MELADTYVWYTPPFALSVTKPGVESEKGAAVIDAIKADVSTGVREADASSPRHSSPFANVPVCTTVIEPRLVTYFGSDPLKIQNPPDFPPVEGSKDAAWHVSWPLCAFTSEHWPAHAVVPSTAMGGPRGFWVTTSVSHNTR